MSMRLQRWVPVVCAAGLVACAAPAVQPAPVALPAPPAAAVRTLPVGEDWRSLLPVPFGGTVSQIPFALKEVLLFQGESRPPGEGDDQECYSKSGAPLHFHGYDADDYVLCFFHERLYRVEAVLRLPKDVPADTFIQWCDQWLTGLGAADRNADHCEGRENDSTFSAGMTYDTEIAGPLVTLVVFDQPTRDLYEQRLQERAEKAPPQGKTP